MTYFPSPVSPDAYAHLEQLWARGRAFLQSKYAILGGAMTWVSNSTLVASISNAGGFGVIACGVMTPVELRNEIQRTRAQTGNTFGVNIIVMHPQSEALLEAVCDEGVSHVCFAGGFPGKNLITHAKDRGVKVLSFVPSLSIARRFIRLGVDALILEGSEAGGHVGPTSTSVLAQEILPHLTEVPVFIAGGIGSGNAILAYLEMGAAGCQLGTRFAAATEAPCHPRFKEALIHANARDAVVSVQLDPRLPVIPVRAIANAGTAQFLTLQREVLKKLNAGDISQKEAAHEVEHFWAGALRRAVVDGDIEHGSLMAGQSVGMVSRIETCEEILTELVNQVLTALTQRQLRIQQAV